MEDELRRIGRVVGEARDWDVFCLQLLHEFLGEAEEWVQLLRRQAEDRRIFADTGSARELDSPAFTSLVLCLAASSDRDGAHGAFLGGSALDLPLSDLAPDLLDKLLRKAEKRSDGVGAESAASDLHPLRKSLKKLRYGAEFVSTLYPPKATKRYLGRLKRILKALGAINDAAMAMRLAEELTRSGHVELSAPVGALAPKAERAVRKSRRKFGKRWDAFRRETPFCR